MMFTPIPVHFSFILLFCLASVIIIIEVSGRNAPHAIISLQFLLLSNINNFKQYDNFDCCNTHKQFL